MKTLLQKYITIIIGIILGATGGFFYYHYVGCASGACPITSNLYISIIYGALLGYLISDLIGSLIKKISKKGDI